MFQFDYTERVYTYSYFGISDILAKIGGLNASIMPIVGRFAPFFALYFMLELAAIIKDHLTKRHGEELKKFICLASVQLFKIEEALKQKKITMAEQHQFDIQQLIHLIVTVNFMDDVD